MSKKMVNLDTKIMGVCQSAFKEQMKQDIIQRVWQMAEKEKEHLNWLIDNNAPKEMIETSRNYLNHFIQRHKEYQDYVADY